MFKDIYRMLKESESTYVDSDILLLRGLLEKPVGFKARLNKFKQIVQWQKIR